MKIYIFNYKQIKQKIVLEINTQKQKVYRVSHQHLFKDNYKYLPIINYYINYNLLFKIFFQSIIKELII